MHLIHVSVHLTSGFLNIFWVTKKQNFSFSSIFSFPFLLFLFFLIPLFSQINSSALSSARRFTKLSPLELEEAVTILLSMSSWPGVHLHRKSPRLATVGSPKTLEFCAKLCVHVHFPGKRSYSFIKFSEGSLTPKVK